MSFMNCQTETTSAPKLVFMNCLTCKGSGKMLYGSGTGTVEILGYERDCFGCQGSGRIIDLDATMRGVTDAAR